MQYGRLGEAEFIVSLNVISIVSLGNKSKEVITADPKMNLLPTA